MRVRAILLMIFSLALQPVSGAAQDFQELRTRYFIDRSVEYAEKLLLREEILSVLYQCTTDEIEVRNAEGIDSSLLMVPLAHRDAQQFDRDAPGIADAGIGQRYRLWIDFEEKEYQRRLQTVLVIRTALIRASTSKQKQRMFRRELKYALKYYADNNWDPARILFDRLLNDYDCREVDDILFYQGQVCIQQGQLGAALGYLLTLIEGSPQSKYRPGSYDQASAIISELNDDRRLIELYRNYLEEGSPGQPEEMGGMHVRAARARVNDGEYHLAVTTLERVDPDSPYFLASRYLLAECLARQEDWMHAVDVLTGMLEVKRGNLPYDRWLLFRDEARVKLAYIYYQWGDYEEASRLFKQVKSNSPFYDRALLGHAWIAFQLDKYEETIQKSEELLGFYPYSSEIYEAGSLAGYCHEWTGDEAMAMAHFFSVLEAGVGQSNLQPFMKERQLLTEALNQLRALEEAAFSSDDEALFETYRNVRNLLEINQKKVGLAELLEVNTRLRGLVAERVLLDKLMRDADLVEETIMSGDNAGLVDRLLHLEKRTQSILEELETMRIEQMKSTPLYYREAYIGHVNAVADRLSNRVESEIDSLTASIAWMERLYKEALEIGRLDRCMTFGLQIERSGEALNRSYDYHTLSEMAKRPALKTRLDRWSDFSFHRFAMGGMEFEELDRKYERLKQVEHYILTLMELLEVREMERDSPIAATPAEESISNLRQNGTE